ncbi:MAG: methyl-accepting chemotaxis protein [Cyanobacteria bacterium P01_G01_bin.54]
MQDYSAPLTTRPADRTFRLRNWIVGGFTVPILLSIITSGFILHNIGVVRSTEKVVREKAEIASLIGRLGFDVQTISRATRGYLLKKSDVSLNSFNQAIAEAQEHTTLLEEKVTDEQQRQTFEQIKAETERLKAIDRQLINLVDQGQVEVAIAQWDAQNGRAQSEVLSDLFHEFEDRQAELLRVEGEKAESAVQTLNWLMRLTALATIAISGSIALLVISTTTRRLNSSANTLAAATSQIAATVEEQERTITQQAASVNETTTTMDELGAASRQSAQQAEAASAAAQQALQMADNGTQAVNQALEGMTTLKTKVGAIAAQILHLSEQTGQIGNISQLVSDLANQTNMLALNAAVEAVRAGEHGKGFSVVATEIRKLADQSRQSAQKINDLVTDIQAAINSTVMVTDEGTKTVDASAVVTQSTAETFDSMANALNNVVLNNQQISLNIKQQATAIGQVVEAMNTINQGARETTNGIRQTKIGTQQLREMATYLKRVV